MSIENHVKRLGRVEYIEPNSLFVHSDGDKIQNGIPQPYEDYSFSVNLRVINGDRYSCGRTSDGGDITQNILEYSSDNGTISFMDGTSMPGQQGYLTTNFTDISMNNPESNTRECLGIESISIKYDSWYYPTVTIKFVDVRGASLMLPSEYEYYNTGGPNLGKDRVHQTANSDFFRAFFSFPYPMFKLSVKGFYGKEVTYDLSVLKCNVDFNSSTGNFEVNASFIGYMYGMYADLPFPFVYLAPYISLYGMNTWDEKKGNGDFCYIDTKKDNKQGRAMYTFPELRQKVEDTGKESDKLRDGSAKGKMKTWSKTLFEKIDSDILKTYPMSPSSGNTWWSWPKEKGSGDGNGYYFLPVDNSDKTKRFIFVNFYAFSKELHNYNKMISDAEEELSRCQDRDEESLDKYQLQYRDEFNEFYNEADALLAEMKEKGGNEFSPDDITKIIKDNIAILHFTKDDSKKDSPVLRFDGGTESSYGTGTRVDYEDLIKELQERFNNNEAYSPMSPTSSDKSWTIYAVKTENINYRKEIVNTSNDLKKLHNELVTELAELRVQDIVDALGFDPTMRNMFNMVFAHIDTFMSVYYNTLDRIRKSIQSSSDDSRSYEKLCGGNGSSKIEVDVSDGLLKNTEVSKGKLPPFTLFYKEETVKDTEDKKFTIVWPGDLPGGEELDEVKLVEAIIDATALNRRSFEPVMPKDNVVPLNGSLVPTNYYDIIHSGSNPYLDVINENSLNNSEILNDIIDVFIFRCYYSFLNGSYVAPVDGGTPNGLSNDVSNFTEKAKLLAKLEAGNVARAFQAIGMSPNQNFITGLHKSSQDGSTIFSGRQVGKNQKFTSTGSGDISYNWINRLDYACLPVGVFSNSVLDNFANKVDEFGNRKNLGKYTDRFLKIRKNGTRINGDYACRIYPGGKFIEKTLGKYDTGEFVMASKLFKNYNSYPDKITEIKASKVPNIPSVRKTAAGNTSIFMDPLYYAQKDTSIGGVTVSKAVESRAYLYLMGVPYGDNSNFFLPDKVENGDYPTLLLLREGAVYWRNSLISTSSDEGAPIAEINGDPITYEYKINGITNNVLSDIEKNDSRFGVRQAVDFYKNNQNNASEGRRNILIEYFLKWANGINTEAPSSVQAEATYKKPEIPSTVVSFSEIESNLALWENASGFKRLLTPDSCISAVTNENVNSFANSPTLKEMYNVGPDNKLGKANRKIRTNVYLRDSGDSVSAIGFLGKLKKFYSGCDTFIDFSCLDNPNNTFTVPRSAMNDALSEFIKELKYQNNITNEQLKNATETDTNGVPKESYKKPEQFKNSDMKLACYQALKSMYDRWLCSRRRESWYFSIIPERLTNNGIRSDFRRFYYIDEFYHDIGMTIRPNITRTAEMASKEGGFTEKTDESKLAGVSIMKVLSNIGEFGGCALLTLPTMLGLAKSYTEDNNSIEDVFKAIPYNEAVRTDGVETSFILLYSNQKSSVLENEKDSGKNGYKTDGFDIANTWGEIVPQSMFTDGGEDGFVVPSFGVTFAKQNQSYFKDIRLSMEDHKITEFSIRNEIMISYQQNTGPRETTIVGQDLYSVYSNYSYSCDVSMMGDAQITPLMYFQLNNIPMWKGAYLITNVHHDISAGRMETVFTGVRQARPTLPNKGRDIDNGPSDAAKETPQSQVENAGKPLNDTMDASERPLDEINVDDVKSIVFVLDRNSLSETESGEWINGTLSARVYYNDDTEKIISNFAITREKTYGMTGRIEDYNPEDTGNSSITSIPSGRFSKIFIENPIGNEEYRNAGESFYNFTDGKHIYVNDSRIGFKRCEIITGETNYADISFGFSDISLGGTCPIMLYGSSQSDKSKEFDKNKIRSVYSEVFDLVKRKNEAKKPLSMLINEPKDGEWFYLDE